MSVQEFYKSSSIFVTGATGFLGKVLVEKLLRSCDGIQNIYILLREKRGFDNQQRFEQFLNHHIFDKIREDNPENLKKLKLISGDVEDPNLHLCGEDMEAIMSNINVVFHVAASVRFNEPLENSINLNSYGTFRVMELCTKIKNLKSIVYVSTAYSNPHLKLVEEKVYGDKIHVTEDVTLKRLINEAERLKKVYPNNYTISKSIAERIVLDYYGRLPVCIVRPSIVTSALNEPYKGWIDGISAPTAITLAIGLGMAGSVYCNGSKLIDSVPVDLVCNTMILAAWENSFRTSQNILVYNCTSGQINSLTHKTNTKTILNVWKEYPTKSIIMYPEFKTRKNYWIHKFYEIFLHFLPAIIFDLVLKSLGKKPRMLKNIKLYTSTTEAVKFCLLNEWIFKNDNFRRLSEISDENFSCDVARIKWDEHTKNEILGIRKFILKDNIESMKEARTKLKRLYWINNTVKALFMILVCYIILKLL